MRTSTELIPAQPGHALELSRDDIETIKRTVAKGATDAELALFVRVCRLTGMDPLTRQIYAIRVWDPREKQQVMQFQVSVDGLRLIADRTGAYRGQTRPEWCGEDGVWREVWVGKGPPSAARVGVHREGFAGPVWGLATYAEFARRTADGNLMWQWRTMPAHMLAVRAETQALRKAFPRETADLETFEDGADPGEYARATTPVASVEALYGPEPEGAKNGAPHETEAPAHGEDGQPQGPAAGTLRATEPQVKAIYAIGHALDWDGEMIGAHCRELYGADPKELSRRQASQLIDNLQRRKRDQGG